MGRLPLAAAAALLLAGCAVTGGRFAAVEENDVFNLGEALDTDQDYTQGAMGAWTSMAADTPAAARDVAAAIPFFGEGAPVHLGLVLGQEIYTPRDLTRAVPDPDDRPYAGWLHAGVALQVPVLDADPERRRDRVDHLQADLGVIGPAARGEDAQNTVHRILDIPEARGWDHQLENEPGFLATWETRWRWAAGGTPGRYGWDFLPRVRARAGNVRVDGTVGADARIGWSLPRDFGPMAVDSHGLGPGGREDPPWIALIGGVEVRGVVHDIFLEGNTFEDGGPGVTPYPFVIASRLGVTGGFGPLSVTFLQTWNSPDFREDPRYHQVTTILIAWTWRF
jgi:hypothetical protein